MTYNVLQDSGPIRCISPLSLVGLASTNWNDALKSPLKAIAQQVIVLFNNKIMKKLMNQQFLSNMSHKICPPMNAIIGFTKVLLITDVSLNKKNI